MRSVLKAGTEQRAVVVFPSVRLESFRRNSEGGEAVWVCDLQSGVEALLRRIEEALRRGGGVLKGGEFQLTADSVPAKSIDGSVDTETEIGFGYVTIGGFSMFSTERKGFRPAIRFRMAFTCACGAEQLEQYMTKTGNATGNLRVTHAVLPEQQNLAAAGGDQ